MISYRREIDGLRALAVLPVILFHGGSEAFAGGFVGVDVFFVTSGYLITSIILAEREAGSFTLAGFYERRARRILPALFLVMAVCLPLAWLWLLPGDLKDFAGSLVAVSLFVSNVLFALKSGYFDTAAELKPLLHTWSLAVEEQYYVLFPLFLMSMWRFGKRHIAWALALIGAVSLAWAQWGAFHRPVSTFFLLPTRTWELAMGALVAMHFARRRSVEVAAQTGEVLSALGIALIIVAVVLYDRTTPFPSLYALVPTAGTALVILFAAPTNTAGRLLGGKLLVGIGLLSYSAYLWHQPLFAFARHRRLVEFDAVGIGLIAGLSIALAYLSQRFVEKPFRDRSRFTRSQIFASVAVGSVFFTAVGIVGMRTDGFEAHYVAHRLTDEESRIYELVRQHTGKNISRRMVDDGECRFWSSTIDAKLEERFAACAKRHGRALIILGDSHALNLYNIVAKSSVADFVMGLSQGGCRPHDDRPYCHYAGFQDFLKRHAGQVDTVVFHQSGSYLFRDAIGKVDSQRAFEPDAPFLFARDNVEKIGGYLDRMSDLARVVWLGPFVEARRDFRDLRILSEGMTILPKSQAQFELLDQELKKFKASASWRFRFVSLHDILDLPANFLRMGECITFNDKDHFSACGEDILANKIRTAYSSELLW